MRKAWFEHVRKTRAKQEKKTKEKCSHREAMKIASETWPKMRAKIEKKAARDAKKASKIETKKT